ncbi:MAG: linear amide C-N hydrolase [Candidatus Heimdallarchaeota archaeon]|nr:linear amide C-N hydrolase [Candidatus Heimdallarchaeota archaeon]
MKEIQKQFSLINLKGTSYEIGYQQGEFAKEHRDEVFDFAKGKFNPNKSGFDKFEDILEIHDSYIPGIIDEFQGFADALNVKIDQLTPIDYPNSLQNNCSHMVFLPETTENDHTFVARTYDWHYDDEDLRLLTTKTNEAYTHIGFSTLLTGRTEGMNEKGLCVIMAGGGAWDYPTKNTKAFNFAFGIRKILDSCNSVNQAIDTLTDLPINTSTNYLIADKNGNAVIVEGIDCEYSVREVDDDKNYLYGTNHYRSKDFLKYNEYVNNYLKAINSYRDRKIEEFAENHPSISISSIQSLLSSHKPDGICTPYYSDWFGVLWSSIFDLNELTSSICLGTPNFNDWNEYTLENVSNQLMEVKYVHFPSGFSG